jgi:hypothetical protein
MTYKHASTIQLPNHQDKIWWPKTIREAEKPSSFPGKSECSLLAKQSTFGNAFRLRFARMP